MVLSSCDIDGQTGNRALPSGGYWCKMQFCGHFDESDFCANLNCGPTVGLRVWVPGRLTQPNLLEQAKWEGLNRSTNYVWKCSTPLRHRTWAWPPHCTNVPLRIYTNPLRGPWGFKPEVSDSVKFQWAKAMSTGAMPTRGGKRNSWFFFFFFFGMMFL